MVIKMGDKLTHIATMFLGIALVALILNRYQGAATLIDVGGRTFGSLLNIVTLQNSMGGSGFAGRY